MNAERFVNDGPSVPVPAFSAAAGQFVTRHFGPLLRTTFPTSATHERLRSRSLSHVTWITEGTEQ
jgi:hypothetical protein